MQIPRDYGINIYVFFKIILMANSQHACQLELNGEITGILNCTNCYNLAKTNIPYNLGG